MTTRAPPPVDTDKIIARLQKRLERERVRRAELERFAESATRRMYDEQQNMLFMNKVLSLCNESVSFDSAAAALLDLIREDAAWLHAVVFYNRSNYWQTVEVPSFQRQGTYGHFLDLAYRDVQHVLRTFENGMTDTIRAGSEGTLVALIQATGKYKACMVLKATSPDYRGKLQEGVISQICSLLSYELRHDIHQMQISELTSLDSVSKLPVRHQFLTVLNQMLKAPTMGEEQLALFNLDINQFRFINDQHGFTTGNELLYAIGQRLAGLVENSLHACRLSADSYVFLKRFRDRAQLDQFAEHDLHQVLQKPYRVRDATLAITANCGYVIIDQETAASPEILISHAEVATMKARQSGNSVSAQFDPEHGTNVTRRMNIQHWLQKANLNEDFFLLYQPIVNLTRRDSIGLESLLRWNSEHFKRISPAEFVPVLEDTGMINAVGQFVIQRSLEDLASWLEYDTPINKVHINISPRQFSAPDFIDRLLDALKNSSVPVEKVGLEITEGMILDNSIDLDGKILAVKSAGLELAIDDFGTGFSSHAYLSRYPFSMLKIDKSLIDDFQPGEKGEAVVRSIVVMAHELGLKVVAEGIESVEQADRLREIGCDYGQGYYFAKPMPAEDVPTFVQSFCKGRS